MGEGIGVAVWTNLPSITKSSAFTCIERGHFPSSLLSLIHNDVLALDQRQDGRRQSAPNPEAFKPAVAENLREKLESGFAAAFYLELETGLRV